MTLKIITTKLNKMSKSIIVCALLMYSTCITSQNDQQLALIVHNEARAELGIAPLAFSEKLAKQAQTYAKNLEDQ